MILQGPSKTNLTLDEHNFKNLQNLIVLEIHGFPHKPGVLKLRKNALDNLENLRYINFQHVQFLGDPLVGNRQLPPMAAQLLESDFAPVVHHEHEDHENNIIQFIPFQGESDIVPYNVYQDQQERAGLSTFAGLHNLLFLRLFQCNIKEVNWEMFDGLQNLEYLSLEGNKIPFLHEFSFYGTPNLKHLSISHNKLFNVQSTDLAGLLQLEILDLSYNNISHLSELSLPPFPKLITADFHHNPLELILPHTFQVLNETEHLFLGGKSTRLEIKPKSFLGLTKLKKMSINGVNLEVLERDYLKGMRTLRELRIEGTIHEIEFDAFADVPKLQELIMKHCSISKISMDAFFGLFGLMYLDLSHNELETLPPALFDQQQNLKEIYLHNNKLTTLPQGLFENVPAKLIRLDKNPWHCTCAMNDWQPPQINKIKTKIIDNTMCQKRYDKGSMCTIQHTYQYKYDQSVSPRCATPTRFSGWSVFHLLRKHLRCHEKVSKEKPKQSKHLEQQFESSTTGRSNIVFSNFTSSVTTVTKTETSQLQDKEHNTGNQTSTNTTVPSTPTTQEPLAMSYKPKTNLLENQTSSVSNENGKSTANNSTKQKDIPDNQFMWSQRNKDKYKLLQEKEERITKKLNNTLSSTTKQGNQEPHTATKLIVDKPTKLKKQSSNQKKWEMKMESTKRRLDISDHPNHL